MRRREGGRPTAVDISERLVHKLTTLIHPQATSQMTSPLCAFSLTTDTSHVSKQQHRCEFWVENVAVVLFLYVVDSQVWEGENCWGTLQIPWVSLIGPRWIVVSAVEVCGRWRGTCGGAAHRLEGSIPDYKFTHTLKVKKKSLKLSSKKHISRNAEECIGYVVQLLSTILKQSESFIEVSVKLVCYILSHRITLCVWSLRVGYKSITSKKYSKQLINFDNVFNYF